MTLIERINLKKLRFCFVFTSCLFGFITVILLIIAYFQKQFPDLKLLFYIGIGGFIVLPFWICIVAISAWYLKKASLNKFYFELKPKLSQLGFNEEIINLENRWVLADTIYSHKNETKKILCLRNTRNQIEFVFANSQNKNVINMNRKQFENMSLEDLKKELFEK